MKLTARLVVIIGAACSIMVAGSAVAVAQSYGRHGLRAVQASAPTTPNNCGATFRGRFPFVGVNEHTVPIAASDDEPLADCELGAMAAEHIGYFRLELDWLHVETAPNQFTFSLYDPFFELAARHHIRVLVNFDETPAWESTAGPGDPPGLYPPRSAAVFAQFAALCVERYGPGGTFWRAHPDLPYLPVSAWEIWNEPNLPQTWEPKPSPRAYVQLLKASYGTIKKVDPHATVVTGGMPFYGSHDETAFIDAMYRYGARGHFDALALHPYSAALNQTITQLNTGRKLLNQHGDGRKGLWVTEVGWAGGVPDAFKINPRGQARIMSQFFDFVRRNRSRLRLREVMWFEWQDDVGWPPRHWSFHEGVLNLEGQPKPALPVLARAARTLDG